MEKIKKLIPNTLKIFVKSLVWRWYMASNRREPFYPLYKHLIKGKPVDRFYIEHFLETNSNLIKGTCLEVSDNAYTTRFGKEKVTKSDILDIEKGNKKATIIGDLKNLPIPDNTYDCIILTQTLQYIDEYQAAIRECHRILKPNGVLLATVPTLARIGYTGVAGDFWRFTERGAKHAFKASFKEVHVEAFGNARTCFKSLVGATQEFSTAKELAYHDPNFSSLVAIRAIK